MLQQLLKLKVPQLKNKTQFFINIEIPGQEMNNQGLEFLFRKVLYFSDLNLKE